MKALRDSVSKKKDYTLADMEFAKLGYEKCLLDDKITGVFIIYDKRTENKRRIAFYKDHTISCSENYLYNLKTTMQELKAINEKVKELGWYE